MKKTAVLAMILIFCACNRPKKNIGATALLITDVSVVDVRSGSILENRQVVVDSGKIVTIADRIDDPESYPQKIDGKGKYLMPGLAEMHAHIPPPTTDPRRIEETLFLYLSNGITTIRGMLGDPAHLSLREKARNGDILSPRIFTSSPSLNGNTVSSKEEAKEKVTAYGRDGYDFLKIHPGVPLEAFDQIVATANEVGIPFAGHVPVAVGIRHALESKYASIDHVDGFLEGLVPESAGVDPSDNGFFGYAFTPLADTTMIDGLVQMAKTNKVWIVPTQSLFERWFAPIPVETLLAQPEMKYMPKSTLANWERIKKETMADESFTVAQWQQFDAIRKKLIHKLQQNGHGMLLGSDAPQLFNVPGFSIHHEIQGMLNAGLTPLEIIRSGTINPAAFFDRSDTFGEIKEGMQADLILVDVNPLEDLSALQKISGVMVRGRWLDSKTIADKLAEIAEHAQQE
jgi:imidazolonepropionase-like amidohydrolase